MEFNPIVVGMFTLSGASALAAFAYYHPVQYLGFAKLWAGGILVLFLGVTLMEKIELSHIEAIKATALSEEAKSVAIEAIARPTEEFSKAADLLFRAILIYPLALLLLPLNGITAATREGNIRS